MSKGGRRWRLATHEISKRHIKCANIKCGNSVRNPDTLRPTIIKLWSPYCHYCKGNRNGNKD